MSKFEHGVFYGGFDEYAISKEKFTKEQAIERCKVEFGGRNGTLAIGSAWVRHRAGRNEDSEPCVGWWIEYEQHPRSCPVWVFHFGRSGVSHLDNAYEYIDWPMQEVPHGSDQT